MAQTSLTIHKVRCRSKSDPQLWADVAVLDTIAIMMPNDFDFTYVLGNNVNSTLTYTNVCIIDPTGDGNGTGDPSSASRLSHFEQIAGTQDQSQMADFEICDMFAVRTSDVMLAHSTDGGEGLDQSNQMGYMDSGQDAGSDRLLSMVQNNSNMAVIDTMGLGLGVPYAAGQSTRVGHINIVTSNGNTDDGDSGITIGQDDNGNPQVQPDGTPYLITIKTDSMAFGAPNGNEILAYIPYAGTVYLDTTVYGTDPYNNADTKAPPENTDPNLYIYFPEGGQTNQNGKQQNNSTGINMQLPPYKNATNTNPNLTPNGISQGILWWITKISTPPPPWFWYMEELEFEAYSYFGVPPLDANPKWGYRDFLYSNFYPVIWILSENNSLQNMGSGGADSIESAATAYLPSPYGEDSSGWMGYGIPNFTLLAGGSGVYAPYGTLPLVDPPLADDLLDQYVPNIWQLTGQTQPNLANPNKPWDATTNPYLQPTSTKAEAVTQNFMESWNAVASACNEAIAAFGNPDQKPGSLTNPPPSWNSSWKIPYTTVHGIAGYPYPTWDSFQNGIPVLLIGVNGGPAFPLEVYAPINVPSIGVGQLDPKEWDTQKSTGGTALPPITWAFKKEQNPEGY